MDEIKSLQSHRNVLYNNLLTEREQAIQLASSICPNYDPDNEFWIEVNELTKQIGRLKKDIDESMKKGDEDISKKRNSTTLASSLLASIAFQKHLQPQFQTPPQSIDTSTIASEATNNNGVVGNVSNQPAGNVSNQPA